MIIFLLVTFVLFFFLYFKYKSKSTINKGEFEFSRKNFYRWMNLSKRERYKMAKKDSDSYFIKRKNLLNEIRKEYKTLKK